MSTSNPGGTFSSIPSSVSSFNPGNVSFSWLRRPGGSSWNPTAGLGRVNPNETFLSRATHTSYGNVLEERMQFYIGLYRGGINEMFHDCIVVSDAIHGFVTFELCYDPETWSRITPMCQQFQGAINDVQWRKRVEYTFRELAEVAMDVWRTMESYNVFGSNCQDFCRNFLRRMDAGQYWTTVESAAIGSATLTLALTLLFAVFRGSR